jgi:hypothetical protein
MKFNAHTAPPLSICTHCVTEGSSHCLALLARADSAIVCSNPTQGTDACPFLLLK